MIKINLPLFLALRYEHTRVFVVKPDAKINPPGAPSLITGRELINLGYTHAKFAGINTKHIPDGDYLIDIDFPKESVNTPFLMVNFNKFLVSKLNSLNCPWNLNLIQKTPHGFHLFCTGDFYLLEKTIYSNLGVKFEVFSNKLNSNTNLTILGGRYGLIDKNQANLIDIKNSIHEWDLMNQGVGELFLGGESRMSTESIGAQTPPIPPDKIIKDGERNNTLFKYATNYKNKNLIINLNSWAVEDPLTDDELLKTVLREDLYNNSNKSLPEFDIHKNGKGSELIKETDDPVEIIDVLDPTMLDGIIKRPQFNVSKLPLDARVIFLFLRGSGLAGKLVFIDSFYIYQGNENNLWKKDAGDYINQKAVSIMLQQNDASLAGYIMHKKKLFFDRLADFVKIMASNFTKKAAFEGQTLDVKNKIVTPSKKTDYLTTILPFKLIKGDYNLKPNFMAVIAAITGYSRERMNLLRLAFNKLIFPDKHSQQIVYIYGGPKTGKSSIADFIKSIHGEDMKAANFDALSKPFEASNLIHLKIIYFGDITYLKKVSDLKKWQGRDFIQTERKFEHTNVSNCFSGTLFMTSNYPPERAFGVINDEALSSRILAVPLEFVIIEDNTLFKGPFNLTEFLQEYKEDVIYWALTLPEKLQQQSRTDLLKYSGSESCYGAFKNNLMYGDSFIPVNINKLGPIRQFLEEKVKLTEQMKPLQKAVGYTFIKTMERIGINYFNKKIPTYGFKDYHTEDFRILLLDFMYSIEFFKDDISEIQSPNCLKSYKTVSEDLKDKMLLEIYFNKSNKYVSPFPENFIFLIDPTNINDFFINSESNPFFGKIKKEFEASAERKTLPFITGKDLFNEYMAWLPVRLDNFFINQKVRSEFYNSFLEDILVNLKSLFKYPFESAVRNNKGQSFLGIEWRDNNDWTAMRECSLLKQYDPFYGEWLGVFKEENSENVTEKKWEIFVKPCSNNEKQSFIQIDISFAEYFRCPATFAILDHFKVIDWKDDNFINDCLYISDSVVKSSLSFDEQLEEVKPQVILSEYLDAHYDKLSSISRDYLLRSFVFHSSLIANRFNDSQGSSGFYIPPFFEKNRKNSQKRLTRVIHGPSISIQKEGVSSGRGTRKIETSTLNSGVSTLNSGESTLNSYLPSQSEGGATQNTRSLKEEELESYEGPDTKKTKIKTIKEGDDTRYSNNQNMVFPYNIDRVKTSMKLSGQDFYFFTEYDNPKLNFLKNCSWYHLKTNYLNNLPSRISDSPAYREKFIIDYSLLNLTNNKKGDNCLDNLEQLSSLIEVYQQLKDNWEELKNVFDLNDFLSCPAGYFPENKYLDLNFSLMLRPLILTFWETSLGKINKKLNTHLTEDFLLEIKDIVKTFPSNTQTGKRWADTNRDFSQQSFLPETAYYTLNNCDYGRLKFGKFYLQRLKTKSKTAVTSAYASQNKIFKKETFKHFINKKIKNVSFFKEDISKHNLYVLDIDLSKAHSNISYGLTQSEGLKSLENILATKNWEGLYDHLECTSIDSALNQGNLQFETIKKAIKAFYYKGLQGGNLGSEEAVLRTLIGQDPDKEPPHKFSVDKRIDNLLKKELCSAWFASEFNDGLKALPQKIQSAVSSGGVYLPLIDCPVDYDFTGSQTKKGSSPRIRIVSDVLTNIEFIQVVKVFDILMSKIEPLCLIPLLYEADGITTLCSCEDPININLLENQINEILDPYGTQLYRGPSKVAVTVIASRLKE